jgi:flavin reductase (DIM6/NTAB) family NADH-FMN oxidoreductase RutF
MLDDALSWLEGEVAAEHLAGDHDIVVTHVHRLAAAGKSGPLLRYRGVYGRLAHLDGHG